MRLKTKILLVLVLFLVSFNGKCFKKIFGGGGCPANMCCPGCIPDERYTVFFNDGCSRDLQGQYCFAGFLRYNRCANGNCGMARQERHFPFGFTANPSSANLNSPPSSITISGQAIDATYGAPRVEYFDSEGFLVGSVYATSVAGDGSSLVASVPDLSLAYTGTFTVQVVNMDSEGYYVDYMGSGTLSCWGRDRPDSDGDGYYDDQDCYPDDPYSWDCIDPGGGGGGGGGGGDCGGQVCLMY